MSRYDYLVNSEHIRCDSPIMESEQIDIPYTGYYMDFEDIVHATIIHLILSNEKN